VKLVVLRLVRHYRHGRYYGRLFNMLRSRYPVCVVESSPEGKTVALLERHKDIWVTFYRLAGWKPVDEYKMCVEEFTEAYPGKHLFHTTVQATLHEYTRVPEVLGGTVGAVWETRFHKLLRTSEILALALRGTWREALLREVGGVLQSLLFRGVVPVDYSYNYVIVARRRLGNRWWLSAFNYDPFTVLKRLEARPARVLLTHERIEKIVFEERDVGWGLTVVERY